ncbi:hypothetical protein [Arthrobacter sp. MMS24-S77]
MGIDPANELVDSCLAPGVNVRTVERGGAQFTGWQETSGHSRFEPVDVLGFLRVLLPKGVEGPGIEEVVRVSHDFGKAQTRRVCNGIEISDGLILGYLAVRKVKAHLELRAQGESIVCCRDDNSREDGQEYRDTERCQPDKSFEHVGVVPPVGFRFALVRSQP